MNLLLRKTSFAPIPTSGKLVAIADATGVRFLGMEWTVYCLLLRPVATDRAVIVPPIFLPGREGPSWSMVFTRLSPDVQRRIIALVCDGNPHLVSYGKRQGWVVQRCHFHLKARVRSYLSWGPKSRGRIWGLLALMSIEAVLGTPDDVQCLRHQRFLQSLVLVLRSTKARWAIRGLLRSLDDFRSYRRYPELRLPTTSNAAESLINLLKSHLGRTRGLPTLAAMCKHIFTLFQQKQTINCPPKLQPN